MYYNEEYDFYALSRHEDVAAAFKDFETYSSAYGLDLAMVKSDEPLPVKMIIVMDPPEHRHMRSLVNKVFTPRAIEAMRPMVTDTIDRYISKAVPDRFDVVQDRRLVSGRGHQPDARCAGGIPAKGSGNGGISRCNVNRVKSKCPRRACKPSRN